MKDKLHNAVDDRQSVDDDIDPRDFFPLLADLAPEDSENPSGYDDPSLQTGLLALPPDC
jgi:hypothetical protein